MSIDWMTVLAQIFNFLLLVWLLKRFLYQPILRGIDAREKEIARRLHEAEQAAALAQQAEQEFIRQSRQLKASKDEHMANAMAAIEAERHTLLQRTRQQQEQEQQQWQQHLQQQGHAFVQELETSAAQTLAELLRQALHELSGQPLEQAMLARMPARMEAMLHQLKPAIGQTTTACVSTQLPLPADCQAAFIEQVRLLLPELQWQFAHDATLSPGLHLQLGSTQLEWTLDSYVDDFQQHIDQQFSAAPGNRQQDTP